MFERIPTHLKVLLRRVNRQLAHIAASKPSARHSAASAAALSSVIAIAFSLAFFAGGLALLFGLLPLPAANLPSVDLAVLVLMVPLCALTLAIVVEVLRAAISGLPRVQPPRLAAALSDWRPGNGEG